jgi:hypothetical protein
MTIDVRYTFRLRDVLATTSADPDPRDSRRSVRSGSGSINGSGSADGTIGNARGEQAPLGSGHGWRDPKPVIGDTLGPGFGDA